jgi:hypothetical protein
MVRATRGEQVLAISEGALGGQRRPIRRILHPRASASALWSQNVGLAQVAEEQHVEAGTTLSAGPA